MPVRRPNRAFRASVLIVGSGTTVDHAPTRLAAADLRTVLALADDLLEVRRGIELSSVLLRRVATAVGADSATLTHLDLHSQQEVVLRWPAAEPDPGALEAYQALGRTHPLRDPLLAVRRHGAQRPAALRISDVLSERGWRNTALHREAMPGVTDQLCLSVRRNGDVVHAVTLGRSSGRFTDRQRDMLLASGAHVCAAVRRTPVEETMGLRLSPRPAWVPLSSAPGVGMPDGSAVGTESATGPGLTEREREVLALVVDGLTDAQIARRLELQPSTVSRHLHRIYARHGLANRAAAARFYTAAVAGSSSAQA